MIIFVSINKEIMLIYFQFFSVYFFTVTYVMSFQLP